VLTVRVPAEIIADIEKWGACNDLSRPEAIRRLLKLALIAERK
jgi:hypothetical protein